MEKESWRKGIGRKEGAGYKMGREPVPHKSIEFDALLLDVLWPMQNYFEMLLRSKKCEDRDFAAVGLSLFRDAFEKWEAISEIVKESLGDIEIDLLDEEILEDIFSQPRYLGVTITPNQEKKTA